VLAIKDAHRLMPFAEVMYACDAHWWDAHNGCPEFSGEKWSSHSEKDNDKTATAEKYGLRLVRGQDQEGFSFDPSVIHYGSNSGFQAVNMALLMGARKIVLVGFDMHNHGPAHFFGNHPYHPHGKPGLYSSFIAPFSRAVKLLPAGIEIVNCTPGSALKCFPMMELEEALA
jgi:hypothetical protein